MRNRRSISRFVHVKNSRSALEQQKVGSRPLISSATSAGALTAADHYGTNPGIPRDPTFCLAAGRESPGTPAGSGFRSLGLGTHLHTHPAYTVCAAFSTRPDASKTGRECFAPARPGSLFLRAFWLGVRGCPVLQTHPHKAAQPKQAARQQHQRVRLWYAGRRSRNGNVVDQRKRRNLSGQAGGRQIRERQCLSTAAGLPVVNVRVVSSSQPLFGQVLTALRPATLITEVRRRSDRRSDATRRWSRRGWLRRGHCNPRRKSR